MVDSAVDVHLPPAPPRAEAPLTLDEPPPRVLGFLDQMGLWANLGVSLLGPVGALGVLAPYGFSPLPLLGAGLAVIVGTVLGTLLVSAAAVPGAQTGAPSMVLLRGLFGTRVSYVPTVLNVLQLVGWGVFEIVVIAAAAKQLLPWHGPRWPYVVAAGALTTVLALRPLGFVRVLRRYALAAVVLSTIYLFVQLLRNPLPSLTHGSWSGFWAGTDVVIAVAVSWVPLASDYSRYSRTPRAAFAGSFLGYTATQIAYYVLGLVALATVVRASSNQDVLQHDMFAAFIAVPVGWLAFGVLVLRELDQSFADTFSTVVSIQNVWPRLDRRALAVVVGGLATVLALALQISDYFNFLYLLGSVFVPLFAVFVVDYFVLSGHRAWDVSHAAVPRWLMLVPWALGFAMYQLVYAPAVGGWDGWWQHVRDVLHFTWESWMSASVLSFAVAAVATLLLAPWTRRSLRP
jgi:putative hydroxymethylpyrimidine transporter CytX